MFAELADGGEMRVLKTLDMEGYPGRAAIDGEVVYIPCGYSGIAVTALR